MNAITREEIERIVLDADNRTPLFPIQPKRYSMGISIGERVATLIEERMRAEIARLTRELEGSEIGRKDAEILLKKVAADCAELVQENYRLTRKLSEAKETSDHGRG